MIIANGLITQLFLVNVVSQYLKYRISKIPRATS